MIRYFSVALLLLVSRSDSADRFSVSRSAFQKVCAQVAPQPPPPPQTCTPMSGAWQVTCPGNTDCRNVVGVGMTGNIAPATTLRVPSVTCNASAPGQDFDGGTSTERFQVFVWKSDGGSIGQCMFPCNVGSSPAVVTGQCNGVTHLFAGETYRATVGLSVNVGCVTAPTNLTCTVNYTSP